MGYLRYLGISKLVVGRLEDQCTENPNLLFQEVNCAPDSSAWQLDEWGGGGNASKLSVL